MAGEDSVDDESQRGEITTNDQSKISLISVLQSIEEAMFIDEDFDKAIACFRVIPVVTQPSEDDIEVISKLEFNRTKLLDKVKSRFITSIQHNDEAELNHCMNQFSLLDMINDGLSLYSEYLITTVSNGQKQLLAETPNQYDDYMDLFQQLLDSNLSAIRVATAFVTKFASVNSAWEIALQVVNSLEPDLLTLLQRFITERKLYDLFGLIRTVDTRVVNDEIEDEVQVDVKEIDLVLDEISTISSLIYDYKFSIKKSFESVIDKQIDQIKLLGNVSTTLQEAAALYVPLEDFFLRKSISIAISINSIETQEDTALDFEPNNFEEEILSQIRHSSFVEDSFFILHKCMRRACASRSYPIVCAVFNLITLSLAESIRPEIRNPLKEEEFSDEDIFLTMNNFENAKRYLLQLKNEFDRLCDKIQIGESQKLKTISSELTDISKALQSDIDLIVNQYFMPKLQGIIHRAVAPLLNDDFISYDLYQEDYDDECEIFIEELIYYLDTQLQLYERSLTNPNWKRIGQEAIQLLTNCLEAAAFQKSFTHFGASLFDKNIRELLKYFSEKIDTGVLDKFGRLKQISFLLQLPNCEDVVEFIQDQHHTWKLTHPEIRNILVRRVEFDNQRVFGLPF